MRYLLLLTFAAQSTGAQDLLTVLSRQDNISLFTALLGNSPDLLAQANTGNCTVIVPTDTAINVFNASNPGGMASSSMDALLHYHIINGSFATSSFTASPIFPPTFLTDENYTNVTGGQRVELSTANGMPCLFSAAKSTSKIISTNVAFDNGLIHIVDSMLSIPLPFAATATRAGFTSMMLLLSQTHGVDPSSDIADTMNSYADTTILLPNDLASMQSAVWVNATQAGRHRIIMNSIVTQSSLYTSQVTNETTLETAANTSVILTTNGSDVWADQSKLMYRDYLLSNGVLQVLDSLLDPLEAGLRPNETTLAMTSSPRSLSLGAKIGLGVGITVGIICLILVALIFRRYQQRQRCRCAIQRKPEHEKKSPLTLSSHGSSRYRERRGKDSRVDFKDLFLSPKTATKLINDSQESDSRTSSFSSRLMAWYHHDTPPSTPPVPARSPMRMHSTVPTSTFWSPRFRTMKISSQKCRETSSPVRARDADLHPETLTALPALPPSPRLEGRLAGVWHHDGKYREQTLSTNNTSQVAQTSSHEYSGLMQVTSDSSAAGPHSRGTSDLGYTGSSVCTAWTESSHDKALAHAVGLEPSTQTKDYRWSHPSSKASEPETHPPRESALRFSWHKFGDPAPHSPRALSPVADLLAVSEVDVKPPPEIAISVETEEDLSDDAENDRRRQENIDWNAAAAAAGLPVRNYSSNGRTSRNHNRKTPDGHTGFWHGRA